MKKNLIVFTSNNCPPCVTTKRIVTEYLKTPNPIVNTVVWNDVDEDMALACKFGVRTVPTLLAVDPHTNAIYSRRNSGLTSVAELVELLNRD